MKKLLFSITIAVSIIGCQKINTNTTPTIKDEPKIVEAEGIDVSNMDTLVRPQDDFYNFVNGSWMKTTTIPSDRARWGSFDQLREYTDSVSLVVLNKLIDKKDLSHDQQLVKSLYSSVLDTVARNKMGIQPLQSNLAQIDNIQSVQDLERYLSQVTLEGNNYFYDFGVGPDMKNSQMNTVYLSGPSLGLSREYYQKDDTDSKQVLESYKTYLTKIFSLTGTPDATNLADRTVMFEKQLANELLSFADLRNSDLRYNPKSVEDLKGLVKAVDLPNYLNSVGATTDSVIISEINYYKKLDKHLTDDNIPQIRAYLKAQLINDATSYLTTELEQASFDFYSKKLKGVKEMRSADKRALSYINGMIGEAFGQAYVAEVFPEEAKAKAEEMVQYIRVSFKKHINEATWMTSATKKKALEKLSKFNVKIGYPDNWKDYSALELKSFSDGGSLYQNIKNHTLWQRNKDLKKIDKKVDKTEWFMAPQTVNAYYSSGFNEIVFPAAILQPPFYNFKADAAVNFGGMGAVIGHEISHGFDDSGAKYDGDGNLNNWWSEEDQKQFGALGENLAAQYSGYEPLEGIHINGEATLGENIADLGGLNVAYDGLQMYLKDKGNPGKIDGFTPEQRYFISWATIWRTKSTDEALKNQVKSDFHSPGYYRAIGPLENLPSFYQAFDVKEGDKMYKDPQDRITIW